MAFSFLQSRLNREIENLIFNSEQYSIIRFRHSNFIKTNNSRPNNFDNQNPMVIILNDYLADMKQIVIRFGLLAACLLLLLLIGQFTVSSKQFSEEVIFACFAILFLTFGYVMSKYFQKTKSSNDTNEKAPNNPNFIDQAKIDELKISKREYEVLELIHKGHSNLEISQKLFISESTVKSHVSSLLSKLNAKRRTQAVNTAKELQII